MNCGSFDRNTEIHPGIFVAEHLGFHPTSEGYKVVPHSEVVSLYKSNNLGL